MKMVSQLQALSISFIVRSVKGYYFDKLSSDGLLFCSSKLTYQSSPMGYSLHIALVFSMLEHFKVSG